MGRQVKKKARSFSLTDEEFADLLARSEHHGFEDRNLYLLALLEADKALGLEVALDASKQKVLRTADALRLAAETTASYGVSRSARRVSSGKRKSGS